MDESDRSSTLSGSVPETQQWISEAAYYKAMARGFAPGFEESDWFEARSEYEALMAGKVKNGLVIIRR